MNISADINEIAQNQDLYRDKDDVKKNGFIFFN